MCAYIFLDNFQSFLNYVLERGKSVNPKVIFEAKPC